MAIATFWLAPRIRQFRADNPDIEIRVVVSDDPPNMISQQIDVGFRYGSGQWKDVEKVHLFKTETFPVCAPDYIADAPDLSSPEDLLEHTLLNLDGAQHDEENWAWWLDAAEVGHPSQQKIGFDNYNLVIQAALDGDGVALGFSGILDDLLEKKKLVKPLPQSFSKGHSVYLTTPKDSKPRKEVATFISWVEAQASEHYP